MVSNLIRRRFETREEWLEGRGAGIGASDAAAVAGMSPLDLTGRRFGRLVVIGKGERRGARGRIAWVCRCDCGKLTSVMTHSLTSGATKSCGCYHRERASIRSRDAKTTHGKSHTRLYGVWKSMKTRCSNKNCKEYKFYGARGISVCDDWKDSFESFYLWALDNGYDEKAPRGEYTLDRIDVDGNYCPENCRWATIKEQANNRRSCTEYDIKGEKHTLSGWSEISGVSLATIEDRLHRGWPAERAIFEPPRERGRRSSDN